MAVRPLVPVGFNRKGSNNPFLAALGLDTCDEGLRRRRRRVTHSSWNLREPYGEELPTSLRVRSKLAVLPLHDKVGWEGPGLN